MENEKGFSNTFERKDKRKDTSASSYDLSIANCGVRAGFTDQEIVNTCIAARRKHGEESSNETEELLSDDDLDDDLDDDDESRTNRARSPLQRLSSVLRGTVKGVEQSLPVKRVIKRGSDYDLELNDGTFIKLGTASNVLTPSTAQAAIMDGFGMIIKTFTKKKWERFAQLICDTAIFIETSSEEYETRGWLSDFVRRCVRGGIVDIDDMNQRHELIKSLREFSSDGTEGFVDKQLRLYLRPNFFVRFVTGQYGQRTTERDATGRLSRLGFKSTQLSVRNGEKIDKARVGVAGKLCRIR